MKLLQFLIVFLGGGLGSCSRYFVSQAVNSGLGLKHTFPVATFTVNIVGCFIIGISIGLIERFQFHSNWTLLLATGFCGGFTTFSSFSYENHLLLRNNKYLLGLSYILASLLWGVAATFFAISLIRRV
ncbi:MAG: fluoride efflux transporter CrcB [cyanobacterium endosymbiont of Rhopalodia musculus]|uniref:fluoride efflux transporter CrcB n=1 Tax=cyanobacterium endosymbiont of Epithemia clementina EcSB TaxID=3034674 RepID=UPI00247FA482|nr:fluoride efflux transporter CrcB [cyanobacterium endosymbiont of Epithemia clementina EcSB]WGT67729.1 fluoride efflux transporter CrcB [cyanobacterium endosymbiont of Epithemia clementina EcSB]